VKLLLIGLGVFLVTLLAWPARADRVRTVYANDRTMQPVYLALGRSTVLRFDDKPKTAVVGNANYFNLEYLGSDITIQPQGRVVTNLFVYTEHQTFGLILKVGQAAQYDDLVYVRFKPGYVNVTEHSRKPVSLLSEVPINRVFELVGLIRVRLIRAIRSLPQGVWIVDGLAENTSKENLKADELKLTLYGGAITAAYQRMVLDQDALKPGVPTNFRVIARAPTLMGMSLAVSCRGRQGRIDLNQRRQK
jgi:hypothetical protein